MSTGVTEPLLHDDHGAPRGDQQAGVMVTQFVVTAPFREGYAGPGGCLTERPAEAVSPHTLLTQQDDKR